MILKAEEGFAVGATFTYEALLDLDYGAHHAGAQIALLVSGHKAHDVVVEMIVVSVKRLSENCSRIESARNQGRLKIFMIQVDDHTT